MGALHEGHASLIEAAATECDEVLVSIFVNPTQFVEGEDFERYPRTLEADREFAYSSGASSVWTPSVEEIYPDYPALITPANRIDPGSLARCWEGKFRPGHFEGVVAVVKRLFDLIQPDRAYFGEKDFQQLRVIQDMVKHLGVPVEIIACPTKRDKGGLALSSRNRYLDAEELKIAQSIPSALRTACETVKLRRNEKSGGGEKDINILLDLAKARLDERIRLDYLSIVDEENLEVLTRLGFDGRTPPARILFAGHVNDTRLIDNMSVL